MIIKLTPACYLSASESTARDEATASSVVHKLSLQHDKDNSYDDMALKVLYGSTFIGYIQKRFNDIGVDDTELINNYCFSDGTVNRLELIHSCGELSLRICGDE